MLEFVQIHKVKNIIHFKVVEVNIILCHNSTFLYFHKKKKLLCEAKRTHSQNYLSLITSDPTTEKHVFPKMKCWEPMNI